MSHLFASFVVFHLGVVLIEVRNALSHLESCGGRKHVGRIRLGIENSYEVVVGLVLAALWLLVSVGGVLDAFAFSFKDSLFLVVFFLHK